MLNAIRHIGIYLVMLTLASQASYGQTTFTATSSGDWNGSGSIWDQGSAPTSTDYVVIPAGISVKMKTSATTVARLTLGGELDLDKGDDDLTVTSDVIINGSSALLTGDRGNSDLIVNGNLTVNAGQQLTIQKTSVQIKGITSLNGEIIFDDDDGTYQFAVININAGGTWNNADKGDFTITNSLANEGTFIGCSSTFDCIYEFTGATSSISGSNELSISDLVVGAGAQLTNTANILITDAFSGGGEFVNGNGGRIELQNSVTLDVTTLDFSTESNDLVFAGSTSLDLPAATYHNIEVNFSDDKKKLSIDADVTINNNLTLADGKIELDGSSTVLVKGNLALGSVSDEFKVKSSNLTIEGNVTMDGGEIKTESGSVFNVKGDVITNDGILDLKRGTNTFEGNASILGGDFSLGGNRGAETSDLTVGGTILFSTSGTVEFIQGNFQALNMTIASTATISINEEAAVNVNGQTTVEGTINFEDAGLIPTWTFEDLLINTSSNLLLTNVTTINGELNLTNGNLIIGDHSVELGTDATITGGSSSSYIQLLGSGLIKQYVETSGIAYDYPLGGSDYSPITNFVLNSDPTGTGAFIEFGVVETAHPNRDTPNTPNGDDDGTPASDYISRYWTINGTNITSPDFQISAIYQDSDVTGTESNLVGALYRSVSFGGNTFNDWSETGTVNPASNLISITGDNWGDLYAMDNEMGRLPIQLIMFEASVTFGQVKLEWATASEDNNDFFTIERSTDGRNFEVVKTVKGAGDSDSVKEYETVDPFPLKGRSYYRLKQTDFSGAFEYSKLVSVVVDEVAEDEFKLSPSYMEAGSTLSISNADQLGSVGSIRAMLIDITGRHYELKVVNGQLTLPYSLASNVYVIKVVSDLASFSQKIVVK